MCRKECATYGSEKACCGSGESDSEWRIGKQRPVQYIMYAVLIKTLVLELFRVHLAEGLNCTFVLQFKELGSLFFTAVQSKGSRCLGFK